MENKFAQNVVTLFIQAIVEKTDLVIKDIEPGHKEDARIHLTNGDFLHIQYIEGDGEFDFAYKPNREVFGKFRTTRMTLPEEFFGFITVEGDNEMELQVIENDELALDLAYGVFRRLQWTSHR